MTARGDLPGGARNGSEKRGAVRMKLTQVKDLLQCSVLTGEEALSIDIDTAVAADGMSIVLAAPRPRALLITGLTHIQSVRTANMADIAAIVYVGGNQPNAAAVAMARSKKIVLLATKLGMFDTCGILREQGIKGGG